MQILTHTVGHDAPLTCYVQEPSAELASAAVRPAVLVLPGGGYFMTSDREAEPIALAYLAEGFNAFVLRYAVGPESPFEMSFDDAKAALAWIRDNAAELHIDPAKVAVVGFSAGGHLAASLATAAEDKPDALVACYPVTLEEFGPPVGKEIVDVPSHVSADTPPTFLFSTSDDTVVPIRNSIAFLAALAEHAVPFESHIYLLGPHGISLAKPLTASGQGAMVEPSVAAWLPDSVRFLRTVFGDFAVEGESETYQTLLNRVVASSLDMPLGRLVRRRARSRLAPPARPGPGRRDGDRSRSSRPRRSGRRSAYQPGAVSPEALAALERELAELGCTAVDISRVDPELRTRLGRMPAMHLENRVVLAAAGRVSRVIPGHAGGRRDPTQGSPGRRGEPARLHTRGSRRAPGCCGSTAAGWCWALRPWTTTSAATRPDNWGS